MRHLPGVETVAEHVDEARREGHVEHRVEVGLAHVGIDEQHGPLDMCRHQGVVGGKGRPSVTRGGAREDESSRLSGAEARLDCEAEPSKRLCRGRVRFDEEAFAHAVTLTAPPGLVSRQPAEALSPSTDCPIATVGPVPSRSGGAIRWSRRFGIVARTG